jgi:hypothetical protein
MNLSLADRGVLGSCSHLSGLNWGDQLAWPTKQLTWSSYWRSKGGIADVTLPLIGE